MQIVGCLDANFGVRLQFCFSLDQNDQNSEGFVYFEPGVIVQAGVFLWTNPFWARDWLTGVFSQTNIVGPNCK